MTGLKQGSNTGKVDEKSYDDAVSKIIQLREAAQQKLIEDLAAVDRQESARRAEALTEEVNLRKASEDDLFNARQAMLTREGQTGRGVARRSMCETRSRGFIAFSGCDGK
ncbi:MAG TPA: hypothetical protein VF595_03475 [Tepidisphaeraceae bacterium]|jgi:hypothetical protein